MAGQMTFTMPSVGTPQGPQGIKAPPRTRAQVEKEAAEKKAKAAAEKAAAKKISDMQAVGIQMAQNIDPTKIQPMPEGVAGPTELTPEAKQYYKDVKNATLNFSDKGGGTPEPAAPAPVYTPPPLALGSKPAAEAPKPANTTESNLQEFKDAIGTQDKFRKANFWDYLNAAASGWVGKEGAYMQQARDWQARNDAILASARDEAFRLKLMAEEYKRRGDERSAAAADQAAENAKDRVLRREELNARKTAEGGDAMARLVQQFLGGK